MSIESNRQKKAIILFSGGIDSTFLALKEAEKYHKIFLITYLVPGMAMIKRSQRNVKRLQELHSKKFEHHIIDIKDFIKQKRGGAKQCMKDNLHYRFGYAWCLGCKTSMHLYTIDYCLKNDIEFVLDGSNRFDLHALEQHKKFKNYITNVYTANGIQYLSPHYNYGGVNFFSKIEKIKGHFGLLKPSTDIKVDHLNKKGFDLGRGVGSQYRKSQPSCLVSPVFNLIRLPLKIFLKEDGYIAYAKRIVKDHTKIKKT
jgi:hypothetical protein